MHSEQRCCTSWIPLRVLHRNVWFLISLPVVTFVFILVFTPLEPYKNYISADSAEPRNLQEHAAIMKLPQDTATKRLPHIEIPSIETSAKTNEPRRNFTIHVWNHGERMKRRFLRSYGSTVRDPYASCSVSNCQLETNDSRVNTSDAVLFHLHQTRGPSTLPSFHPAGQIWIFFTDESPMHTFIATRKYKMKDYNGLFNWSMTYRSDSDVPVPYGRTVPLNNEERKSYRLKSYAKLKKRGIAILGSNCGGQNHRWDYVKELQKFINVDIYGGCGPQKCPGHFTKDCLLISDYKFYLAFENSNCKEYITEKLWWNAFEKEAVPVVMGASKSDYERLCPPNSFIHTDDFDSPFELAKRLDYLLANNSAYNEYLQWKEDYKVLNEHGYFGSPSLHLCRICEALNQYNISKPKTYNDLQSFWGSESDCRKASWQPAS